MPAKQQIFGVLLCLALILAACRPDDRSSIASKPKQDPYQATISSIVETEATILDLGPYIAKIGEALAEEAPGESAGSTRESLGEFFAQPTAFAATGDSEFSPVEDFPLKLWQPRMGNRKFIDCKFATLEGIFGPSRQTFAMKVAFEGRLRDPAGIVAVKARQTITWTRINKLWTITHWRQDSFESGEPQMPLFQDVTADAITDAETLRAVTVSSHEQNMLQAIKNRAVMQPLIENMPGFNDWESLWQFPSVSIVDYDADGWDDVFLTDRWSGGMLLKNQNGSFVDVTAESGLVIRENSNCVLFADFDNDGDPDALVGGSTSDSQFFINENGRFHLDTSLEEELHLVRFVTAGSVADFNGDGLLDVYLSTYVAPSGSAMRDWYTRAFPDSDIARFSRATRQHAFVDRGGPANVLLVNEGGKLKRCKIDDALKQWRNSYQSTWHDWDNDGDPDLFVCNDYAPDAFLRNDSVRGSQSAVFTDVTTELIGPDIMGYSMGASWGDFDNDADMDLYVSEMYSKAGNRILKAFKAADVRSVQSAAGSFLFRNDNGSFTQIAGSGRDSQHVNKVGWAFGGQFADFNNDGWLDLYVPSGFFTAPPAVRTEVDL